MGKFGNCKICGEKIEFVINRYKKKIPINIKPSIVIGEDRSLQHVRVNHFVTCCKDKNKTEK
jgi:hypothetical protein